MPRICEVLHAINPVCMRSYNHLPQVHARHGVCERQLIVQESALLGVSASETMPHSIDHCRRFMRFMGGG